jgi:hypothetical protein
MAVYIALRKVEETTEFATYEYGPDEVRVGRIRVLKQSGDMEVLSEVPGDDKRTFSPRAGRKLLLHWRAGEYPETTYWAS